MTKRPFAFLALSVPSLALVVACTSTDVPDNTPGGGTGGGSGVGTGGSAGQVTTGGTAGTGTGGAGVGGVGGAGGAGGVGGSVSGSGGAAGIGGGTAGTPPIGGQGGTPPATGGVAGTTPGGMGGSDAGSSPGGDGGGGMSGSAGSAGGTTTGGFTTCPYTPPADPTGNNFTAGEVTLFNNNGAWTWYSDERAIVDKAKGKIIVGSDANAQGDGGSGRDGNVDAVIYDVATKTVGPVTRLGDLAPDDHNTAAFLVKPDGNYLAFWAGHNENCNSYFSNHNGTSWANQQTFSWSPHGCPFENNRSITYNNLWNMTEEGLIYNFVRSVGTSPNILVSDDNGVSWEYRGRLSSTPTVGYVAGYYKYWGNNVDRIDFFGTEAHPRDNDNNLYHGYIKGGKTYNSMDVEVDDDVLDTQAPQVTAFTKIFSTGTNIDGKVMNHAWNSDIMRYTDGTIAAIGMARTQMDGNNPDHAFLYFRFQNGQWRTTYLGEAGKKLYDSEQDYVGLGALHPNDSRIIYISSHLDPRNDMDLGNHEIFMGVTCDDGMTFQWTPVTWNSNVDNLRPIVPEWDENNMVLLWFRGTYQTAQIYNEDVVGIITQK
jgi:hypothetical protein